jgi:hypothetical protein
LSPKVTILVAAVFVLLIIEGIFIIRHETLLAMRSYGPAMQAGPAMSTGGMAEGGMSGSAVPGMGRQAGGPQVPEDNAQAGQGGGQLGSSELGFGIGRAYFGMKEMEVASSGQHPALEQILGDLGIANTEAEDVRTVFLEHMRRVNEVKMMEHRSAHSAADSTALIEKERTHRDDELLQVVGPDRGARLTAAIGQTFDHRSADGPESGP